MQHLSLFFLLLLLHCITYSHDSQSYAEAIRIDTLSKPQGSKSVPSKFRIGVHIGYGHRISKIPDDMPQAVKDHMTKIKRNVSYGADFLIAKHLGLGFQVSALVGALTHAYYTMGNVTIKEQLDKSQREGLAHIDVSLVLRYYK